MNPVKDKNSPVFRRNGYKLTPQRKAVLDTVSSSKEHLTSNAVHKKVGRKFPGIGLVTVYRTLSILSELGVICRVGRVGKSISYALAAPGHHHHLVCSGCGAVADFSECKLDSLQKILSEKTGYKIEGHALQFSGKCQRCQKKENSKVKIAGAGI